MIARAIRRGRISMPQRIAVAVVLAFGLQLAAPLPAMAQESCIVFGEDLVVAAGELRDCDVSVVKGDLRVEAGGEIDGDANVVGGAVIEGRIRGDLNSWNASTISGRVDGNVYAIGEISIASTARIGGDVTAGGAVSVADGADVGQVRSARDLRPDPRAISSTARARDVLERVLAALGTVLLSTIFAALTATAAPAAVRNLRLAAGHNLVAGLGALIVGMIAFLLFVPAAVMVGFVTFGLGAILLFVAGAVAIALGWVGIGQKLGARIVSGQGERVQTALGTGVLAAFLSALMYGSNLLVVCGGIMLVGVLAAWAFGAALLSRMGTRGPARSEPASWQPPDGSDLGSQRPEAAFDADLGWHTGAPGQDRPSFESEASRSGSGSPEAMSATEDRSSENDAFDRKAEQSAEAWSPPTSTPDPMLSQDPVGFADSDQTDATAKSAAADTPSIGAADPKTGSGITASQFSLEDVTGISPIYAALLRDAGLDDLSALLRADESALVAAISVPGVLPITRATAQAWQSQARDLLGAAT